MYYFIANVNILIQISPDVQLTIIIIILVTVSHNFTRKNVSWIFVRFRTKCPIDFRNVLSVSNFQDTLSWLISSPARTLPIFYKLGDFTAPSSANFEINKKKYTLRADQFFRIGVRQWYVVLTENGYKILNIQFPFHIISIQCNSTTIYIVFIRLKVYV